MKKTDKTKDVAGALAGTAQSVVIEQPKRSYVALEVTGVADLIQNNFSQKAIEQMLRKHMGLSVQKEAKKPREVIEAATIYNMERRVCAPPTAFKKAMLSASTGLKDLKKTQLRTNLYVEGSSIPITFEKMEPRMDMVRTSGIARTPDVRFRPAFKGWKARLVIRFNPDALKVQTVVDLLNRAGEVGIGEWRAEKDGTFGLFIVSRNITDAKEVAEIREQCAVPLVPLVIPQWALDMDIDPEVLKRAFDDAGMAVPEN